jgi:hypothetical protein
VRIEPEQRHIDILRELVGPSVTSFTLKGDRYGATKSLLVLLELTLEYVKAAREIKIASTDLMGALFENFRFFAFSGSDGLMQGGRTVTASILWLSAAGIDFYTQLIERIALELTTELAGVGIDVNDVSKCANELLALYKEIVDCVPASLGNRVFERILSV